MKGVILAAGLGTRLYPVTKHVAKPILPIANRGTLEYAFDRLREIDVRDICIVVGQMEEAMKAALGDGSQYGVRLSYVRQTEPKGLAHATGFAKDFVAGDPFVLYLGDAVYENGFVEAARRFRESGCANMSAVKWVEDPTRFGVANLNGEEIVKLVEKPKEPESNYAMAGIYFFGPELWDVLPDLQPSARGEYEITDAIQALINRGHKVLAAIYEGEWFDTGTLDSFLATNRFLTRGGVAMGEGAELDGVMGESVAIGAGARVRCQSIDDAVILPGAVVETDGPIRHALIGGTVVTTGPIENTIRYGDEA